MTEKQQQFAEYQQHKENLFQQQQENDDIFNDIGGQRMDDFQLLNQQQRIYHILSFFQNMYSITIDKQNICNTLKELFTCKPFKKQLKKLAGIKETQNAQKQKKKQSTTISQKAAYNSLRQLIKLVIGDSNQDLVFQHNLNFLTRYNNADAILSEISYKLHRFIQKSKFTNYKYFHSIRKRRQKKVTDKQSKLAKIKQKGKFYYYKKNQKQQSKEMSKKLLSPEFYINKWYSLLEQNPLLTLRANDKSVTLLNIPDAASRTIKMITGLVSNIKHTTQTSNWDEQNYNKQQVIDQFTGQQQFELEQQQGKKVEFNFQRDNSISAYVQNLYQEGDRNIIVHNDVINKQIDDQLLEDQQEFITHLKNSHYVQKPSNQYEMAALIYQYNKLKHLVLSKINKEFIIRADYFNDQGEVQYVSGLSEKNKNDLFNQIINYLSYFNINYNSQMYESIQPKHYQCNDHMKNYNRNTFVRAKPEESLDINKDSQKQEVYHYKFHGTAAFKSVDNQGIGAVSAIFKPLKISQYCIEFLLKLLNDKEIVNHIYPELELTEDEDLIYIREQVCQENADRVGDTEFINNLIEAKYKKLKGGFEYSNSKYVLEPKRHFKIDLQDGNIVSHDFQSDPQKNLVFLYMVKYQVISSINYINVGYPISINLSHPVDYQHSKKLHPINVSYPIQTNVLKQSFSQNNGKVPYYIQNYKDKFTTQSEKLDTLELIGLGDKETKTELYKNYMGDYNHYINDVQNNDDLLVPTEDQCLLQDEVVQEDLLKNEILEAANRLQEQMEIEMDDANSDDQNSGDQNADNNNNVNHNNPILQEQEFQHLSDITGIDLDRLKKLSYFPMFAKFRKIINIHEQAIYQQQKVNYIYNTIAYDYPTFNKLSKPFNIYKIYNYQLYNMLDDYDPHHKHYEFHPNFLIMQLCKSVFDSYNVSECKNAPCIQNLKNIDNKHIVKFEPITNEVSLNRYVPSKQVVRILKMVYQHQMKNVSMIHNYQANVQSDALRRQYYSNLPFHVKAMVGKETFFGLHTPPSDVCTQNQMGLSISSLGETAQFLTPGGISLQASLQYMNHVQITMANGTQKTLNIQTMRNIQIVFAASQLDRSLCKRTYQYFRIKEKIKQKKNKALGKELFSKHQQKNTYHLNQAQISTYKNDYSQIGDADTVREANQLQIIPSNQIVLQQNAQLIG